MDLTARLLRAGARRPHVLVVATPGGTGARLAVEHEIARRGWATAESPADTDLLVVAGAPGPAMTRVVEDVWAQLPAPRARADVVEPSTAAGALAAAAGLLSDADHQRANAVTAPDERHVRRNASDAGAARRDGGGHGEHAGHARDDEHAGEHGGAEHGGGECDEHPDHGGHDERGDDGGGGHDEHAGHGGHGGEHGGHGGDHGHHGGGMELPGGLAMADLGDDRDGLRLDRLHVPLGPVLSDWPAGLVLRVVLQGDVIQDATAEVLDAGHGSVFWQGPGLAAARELDALARFLGVAGWADTAARARRLRDDLLAGAPAGRVADPARALLRRVRRSRTLRWLVRGIPAGPVDVAALVEQRTAAVEAALAESAPPAGGEREQRRAEAGAARGPAGARPSVGELPALLAGAELAAARLVVAALDPVTEPASPARDDRTAEVSVNPDRDTNRPARGRP